MWVCVPVCAAGACGAGADNHAPSAIVVPCPPTNLQGGVLKKIVEAMKDLVTDTNLECSADSISMQVRGPRAGGP